MNERCIEWTGLRDGKGYGMMGGKTKLCKKYGTQRAQRWAWIVFYGAIPPGTMVLHRCDNPPCINPLHLFLGTHADNMRDMASKGRGNNQRLSRSEVEEIRRQRMAGVTVKELARTFGIAQSYVRKLALSIAGNLVSV